MRHHGEHERRERNREKDQAGIERDPEVGDE
jgi:hypothetical protein